MLRKSVVILAMLMCSMATQVFALGLGTVTVESALNQPLRVRIEIIQLGDTRLDDVTVQMAALADFQRFNIDRVGFLSDVRFRIETTEQGDYVVLTSNQIVREPYLSFILDTRWPNGRLLSEHTVLLDLPVFNNQSQPSTPVQQPVSPVVRTPDPAPPVITEPQRTPTPPPEVTAPEPEPEAAPEPTPEQAEPEAAAAAAEDEPAANETPDNTSLTAAEDDADVEAEAEAEIESPAPAQDPAPAAAPADSQADASDTVVATEPEEPAGPETVETSPNDTLTDIALQVRPDNSVSLQQTMLAIQRLNPDAFIEGNINRMRSGEVLRVPQLTDVQEITAAEAISEINRQNQQFADLQPLTATADAQQADSAEPQGELSVVTDTGDSDGSGSVADDAELEELDQRIADLENTLALQQEEADRARLQREELESRMSELDEQIAAAQEIIRLQDLQLAQLQESLAEAAAEAEAQAAAEAAQLAAIAAAEAEAQQAARSGGIVGDIMRILTGNTMMMVFSVVLVILLLVVLLLRRNRADKVTPNDELDELAEQEFDAASEEVSDARVVTKSDPLVDEELTKDELDSELDDIISASNDDSDFDLDVDSDDEDVTTDADKLIAAAKFGEANAMLRGALDDDSDNAETRLKLAEVLVKQNDKEGFEEQAALIAAADRPDLDIIVASLREQFASDAAESSAASAEEQVETDSFLDDLGIDLDAFDDDDLDLAATNKTAKADTEKESSVDQEQPSANAEESAKADDFGADDDDDFDLSFDLSDDDEQSSAVSDSSDSDADLDIDLDDGIDPDSDASKSEAGAETSGNSKDVEELEIETFDFELGASDDEPVKDDDGSDSDDLEIETLEFNADDASDSQPAAAEESVADAPATADENSVDFAFDTDADDSEAEKPKDTSELKTDELKTDDLETFDFDLEDTFIDKPESKGDSTTTESNENEVSFDLDADEATTPESSAKSDDGDDFDFDLGEFEIDESEAEQASEADKPADNAAKDSDELDEFFDLDEMEDVSEVGENREAKSEPSKATDDSGDDLEDLDFLADDDDLDIGEVELLSDDDEAATKLELAYAYQKMGDADGAREILKEVLKEGNADQIKEAEKLLTSIDLDS